MSVGNVEKNCSHKFVHNRFPGGRMSIVNYDSQSFGWVGDWTF